MSDIKTRRIRPGGHFFRKIAIAPADKSPQCSMQRLFDEMGFPQPFRVLIGRTEAQSQRGKNARSGTARLRRSDQTRENSVD